MAHFAQIDSDSVVLQVIVVGNEDCHDSDGNESEAVGIVFCQNLLGADTNWVQTSYNANIRFRYAGIGMKYDSSNDVFCHLPPYPSWILNTTIWDWEAPVTKPSDAGDNDVMSPTENVEYTWYEGVQAWGNRTVTTYLT